MKGSVERFAPPEGVRYPLALVAGSGLDLFSLLDEVHGEFPMEEPSGPLKGHARRFVLGRCGTQNLIVQEGRFHVYEGLDVPQITRPVDILAAAGVRHVVFTNACGALDSALREGHLVAIDHLRAWPRAMLDLPAEAAPDFEVPGYDARGTYCWVQGPSYETRAEILALRASRGAVVGMSTFPEVVRAQALGMRTGVISCVTNCCIEPQVLSHEHVLRVARESGERLRALLRSWACGAK